jgi:hypothetical protein
LSVTSLPFVAYYGLLVSFLLLAIGLVILAWRRPSTRHRWGRVAASAVAVGALWLLAFPPLREVPAVRTQAILLTNGYEPDTLRYLLRQLGAGTPVWYYGSGAAPVKARPLTSLLALAEQQPALRRLHLLGRGLPAADLPALGKLPVQRHADANFHGFQTAAWQEKLSLGEVLWVEGLVKPSPGEAPAWVCLRAAGALRDSVRLAAGQGAFRLRYQPKTTGLAVYELLLRRGGKVLATEPVPVEITVPQLPSVLLLAATPSFEFKFLKNYLAEMHYPVALRTTISRGLVQTDILNQPAVSLDHLTPAVLAHYATVVADAPTMVGLTAAEAQALQTAVKAGRLGLLVLADAAPLPRAVPARAGFTVLPRAAEQAVPQPLSWPDAPTAARAAMPAQLRPNAMLRALVTGPNRALVAASRRLGLGFVVLSVVPETFQWGLQGHLPVYASYWTHLLTAAAPTATPVATWHLGTRWPRCYAPLFLHLRAVLPEVSPTVGLLNSSSSFRLSLRQDTRLPEWSTAQFWPAKVGWHQVKGPGRTTYSFYVYDVLAWQGPELQQREQALAQRPASGVTSVSRVSKETEPWPVVWFFLVFLLAAGYLWLEEKL